MTTYEDTAIFTLVDGVLATLTPVPYAWDVYPTVSGAELPDTYMVASDVTDMPAAHADNVETHRFYRIQVSCYSRNGLAALPNVTAKMLLAGFMKDGRFKLPYDVETGHFGMAMDYTILLKQP